MAEGRLTCFGVGGLGARVYYVDANLSLIELAWVGGWVWSNLTAITGGPTPGSSVAPLTCFGLGGSAPRVYFEGVFELAWNEGGNNWVRSDVTALAGAPPGGSEFLTCFGVGGGDHPWPSGSDPRVYQLDSNRHVVELAWVGGWVHNDLTAITGTSPAQIDSLLTCFGMGGSDPRVYYLDSNNHVNELAWTGNWVHTDVTAITGAPPVQAAANSLTCFGVGGSDPSVSGPRVYYVDSNNHVNELAWVGGVRRWVRSDVTALTAASPVGNDSPLTCFGLGGSSPRVYYVDGHVNELAWVGNRWVHSDLTALAGGPSPVESTETGLTCFGIGGSDPRVYYFGSSDGHVNELAWVGNRWVNSDLTALTGAPPGSHL
jgi:hypothetical protein